MIAQADLAALQVTGIKTANYAARSGELLQCDAGGGSFTVTLPGSPRINQIVGVKLLETTGGNSVTIARNGNAIEGEAGDLSLSEAGEYLELQYNGAGNWIDRTERESNGNSAVATITASTTLTLDQEVVLCNNSSNITVTLPTASAIAGKEYTIKKIGSNADLVTIDGTGSETIDGAATLVLYVQRDFVGIVSDGNNWQVVNDGRQSHFASIYRGTAQAVPSVTPTRMAFNATAFDVGGIADVVTDGRIEIRRSGNYQINGYYCIDLAGGTANVIQGRLYINGTQIRNGAVTIVSNTGSVSQIFHAAALVAGDYIDLYGVQDSGVTRNTLTGATVRPSLTVEEVR